MAKTLLVNRQDFTDVALVNIEDGSLADGYIRVEIGPWALTANNITYMVTGDHIGYWQYFEPKHYGIDMAGFGRMPVWGYAHVLASNCDGVDVGAEIYGFFPVADRLDMKPVKVGEHGFQDGTAHRLALHPVYNGYSFIDRDPSFATHRNLHPVLRPLFTTSFLIGDFLSDEDFFGAEQVLLLSASSKTALGTAFCLKQTGRIRVAGMTSEPNLEFVRVTGFYDDLQSYDSFTHFNPDIKTVIVDMAGNGHVTASVYDHFDNNIVYNCMVGKSHWQGRPLQKAKLGAPPIMFFAPDRAKQRYKDWGAAGFAQKLAARWRPFCDSAAHWLTVTEPKRVEGFLESYKAFLDGAANPSQGYLFKV